MLLGSELAVLLELVGDGEWHELAELQQKVRLAEHQFLSVAAFLSRFGFVVVDEANAKLKISRDFQELLART